MIQLYVSLLDNFDSHQLLNKNIALSYKIIIANRMTHNQTNSVNSILASKQAYLRTHVPNHQYQDFAQYCQSFVGNIDIETWELQYMKQLIQAFLLFQRQKQAQKQKNKGKHHSFHLYQTGDSKDIKTLSQDIKKEQITMINSHHTSINKKTTQSREIPTRQKQQKSGLQFLDKMFEGQDKLAERKGKAIDKSEKMAEIQGKVVQKHEKTKFETKKYDKSFFQSGRIWQVPVIQQLSASVVKYPVINKKEEGASNKIALNSNNFQLVFQASKQPNVIQQIKSQVRKTHEVKKKQIQLIKPVVKNQRIFEQINIQDDFQVNQKIKNEQNKIHPTAIVNVKTIKKNTKISYDREVIIKKDFRARVSCFKSCQRVALGFKELKVVIQEHEVVNRFLSSDYVMYHLKVLPSNIICKRNMQDFFKLRKQMEIIYPGIRLPYLQKIGWLQSQINPDVIAKQKKFLAYFLEDLLRHKQLRNSRIFQDFLSLTQHKLIKRKFQQYEKLKQISAIEQLCLLQGQVKVQLTQQNRQYNEHCESLTQKFSRLLYEKDLVFVKIEQLHRMMVEQYQKLSDLLIQMENEVAQFNNRVNSKEIPFLSDTFKNLLTYANQHIAININQSSFLKQIIIPFIRYQRQNISTIAPLFATNRQLLSSYLKQKDQDGQPAQYLSERMAPYKQSILQQSKNMVVLKYQCGYLQNCLVEENFHYFEVVSQQLDCLLSDVCYKKLSNLSSTINTLTTLIYS